MHGGGGRAGYRRPWGWILAASLGIAALLWWRWPLQRTAGPLPEPEQVERQAGPSLRRRDGGGEAGVPMRRPAEPASDDQPSDCATHAEQRCLAGDVWWYDGCGEPEEPAEECGLSPCRDATCERPDPLGCDEPITGRCEGDRVRSCFGGRLRVIDCAGRGLHCVMGVEGAECRSEPGAGQPPPACSGTGSRCDGQVLVQCLGAREVRVPCDALGGRCLPSEGGQRASCVRFAPPLVPPAEVAECGACGCDREDTHVAERCNGRDEDGDGLLDEGAECEPIDVIGFVVGRPGAWGSYEELDIEREMQRVNAALRASGPAAGSLSVRLAEVVWLERREWLQLSEAELREAFTAPETHPSRGDFYVPMLFTDEVYVGQVPKPGTSTLPNATCGGSQHGRGPEVGLIAVSKARSPTTVAHELGHFLGLCHTHASEQAGPVPLVAEADGQWVACKESCQYEGDGVCDTPPDPGAQRCPYNSQCQVFCAGGESPDATNLMSYYTDCRYRFSREQLALMQHTLALRRGWHDCHGARCACQLGANDCPAAMACRPFQDEARSSGLVLRCALEGPVPPGGDCESTWECQGEALCVDVAGQGRCARLCGSAVAGTCACEPLRGAGTAVCAQDLRVRR